MLKIIKSMSLNGTSIINGETVVYMNASINSQGNGTVDITKSVSNETLYNENKTEVRKDMKEFEEEVYRLEDLEMTKRGENNE